MPFLSVVIAVYGAEEYIGRCARSLFGQTFDDLEYIFVDDCTPDNSFEVLAEVLEEYPHRKQQVKIIRHDKNMGVAAARSAGMKAAAGKYTVHCDPDDWLEMDAYEKACDAALSTDADILVFGYRVIGRDGVEEILPGCSGSGMELLRNWNYTSVLWNALVRTEIFRANDIYPFPGINSGEDTNTMLRTYLFARKVVGLKEVLYNYNCQNDKSITSISYKANLERFLKPNVEAIEQWFMDKSQDMDIVRTLKCAIKGDILFRKDVGDVHMAISLWPEVNDFWVKMNWYSPVTRLFLKAGMHFPSLLSAYCAIIEKR